MRILLRQLALLLSEEALVFTDAIVEEIKTEIKNKKFFNANAIKISHLKGGELI